MATTLNNTEQQRRAFMADIAHELRTPLTVLKGELEAVEDGIREPDRVLCARLQQQTEQLTRLVADIDTLAQAQAGGMSYQSRSLAIRAWLEQQIAQFQPLAQQQQLELRFTATPPPPPPQLRLRSLCLQDSARLQQALQNLLQNSLRYTQAPGVIQVTLATSATAVLIEVEDSAPGVATEHS